MSDLSLNELTFENIASWPIAIKSVLVSVCFSIIIGLGYFLTIQEQYETLMSLRTTEIELLETMSRKQHQAASLRLYQAQLAQMRLKFGKLLKQLPGKSEIPELLEEISQKGLKAGLKFQLFDPEPEISHDFYVEVPIKIKVDGSFHQIANFISSIANMKRIVTMHDFKLRFPSPRRAESKKPLRLINGRLPLFLTITAKVYRYQSFD
jgi:type IV pilus assembly protein PilO